MRPLVAWVLVAVSAAALTGCSSWQAIPLAEVEAQPEDFVGEKLRAYLPTATPDSIASVSKPGRSLRPGMVAHVAPPDSLARFRVVSINYPMVSAITVEDARMYGTPADPRTFTINLAETRRIEARRLSVTKTALLVVGVAIVYAMARNPYP